MFQDHKGTVSISRCYTNDGSDGYMSIELDEKYSRTRAIRIKVPLNEFAKAVFGSRQVNCDFQMNDSMKNFGMKPVHEQVEIKLTEEQVGGRLADTKKIHEYIMKNFQREGEYLSTGYGSQGFITYGHKGDDFYLKAKATYLKFVPMTDEEKAEIDKDKWY